MDDCFLELTWVCEAAGINSKILIKLSTINEVMSTPSGAFILTNYSKYGYDVAESYEEVKDMIHKAILDIQEVG